MNLREHIRNWSECERCPLHLTRKQVVHYRGYIPARVVYYGTAPGVAEDTLGQVMLGPTKEVLDRLNMRLGLQEKDICYIYSVGCRSCVSAIENRDPTSEEIRACAARVHGLIELIKPVILIAVGNVAKAAIPMNAPIVVNTVHPAFILRTGGTHKYNRHWRQMYDTIADVLHQIDYYRSYND